MASKRTRLPHQGLLLLLILVSAGVVRWHGAVTEGFVKPDETVYVSAAEHWTRGDSPYEEINFFYTPVYAAGSAWLVERFGALGYLQIQRWINLVGVCLATWLAFHIAGWRFWPSVGVGILWLWVSPVVSLPTQIGNATGLPTAMTLAALALWQRLPSGAGLALGLGQALKPITPLAPFCFLAHRAAPRKAAPVTGWVALASVGLSLVVGFRFLPGIFGNATGSTNPYNFSTQHVLANFGLELRPILVLAACGFVGVWWIRSRRLSPAEFAVATLTLNLVAAPILWGHSLLVFLPVQLVAAAEIVRRIRMRSGTLRLSIAATVPHILATLALASTILAGSVGGPIDVPSWMRGAILALPLASIAYLGGYALRSLRTRQGQVSSTPEVRRGG